MRRNMKGTWEEAGAVAVDWLPPVTEWDFRSVREKESRLACCWEYARDCRSISGNLTQWLDGAGGMTTLGEFICTHGMRFPTPWIMAGDELSALAEGIEAESAPITVYSLRTRKEFVLREVAEAMEDGRDVLELLNRLLLADGYVMTMAFETAGSNAVVKALTGWAREEANKFPRVRRGKGAAPPFEWLKWLAAARLEEARQAAGISFSEVQRMLLQHAREHPLPEAAPTLPIYSSHGAWSKAIGDARKWLAVLETEPLTFERRVLG
jgi:hypothetical protein